VTIIDCVVVKGSCWEITSSHCKWSRKQNDKKEQNLVAGRQRTQQIQLRLVICNRRGWVFFMLTFRCSVVVVNWSHGQLID